MKLSYNDRQLMAVVRAFRQAPVRAVKAARQSLTLIGIRWERDVKGRFRPYTRGQGILDINTSSTLRSSSSRLKNSIRSSVVGRRLASLKLLLQAGSAGMEPYANIQEYGGTIHSKGKLLTIPTIFAKDSRGQIRPDARLSGSGRGTQGGLDTYVKKTAGGNLFIFARRFGAGVIAGPGVPLYLLRRSVRIPKRLGMRTTLTKVLKEEQDIMMRNISRAVWPTKRLIKASTGSGPSVPF